MTDALMAIVVIYSQHNANKSREAYDAATIRFLKEELNLAAKNDHRDPASGRYVRG
jgi:hypothetical protein